MKTIQTVGYLRVSTDQQTVQNQKLAIFDYAQKNNLQVDRFVEVTISSRRSVAERKILETLNSLHDQDILIVTELSRLGRSTVEVLTLTEQIIANGITLLIIKENLKLNKHNRNDITNVVMLHVFSLLASLERNLISLRTKEGLAERKSRGVVLGKPKGSIQKSIYDAKKDLIIECLQKGMNIPNISKFLAFGTARGLTDFINRRNLKDSFKNDKQ